MTGFELLEYLTKQDAEVLRCQIYAGSDDWDEIVDAQVDDGAVNLQTFRQRWEDDQDRKEEEGEDYWDIKEAERKYDDYVQEKIRRER